MVFSLVIPCYNFAASLPRTLESVSTWRRSVSVPFDVYFVDDGSADGSGSVLARFAAENSWCKVIRLETNRGKGVAIRAGVEAAGHHSEYVVFTDCDLHYGLTIITDRVLPELEDGADVVIVDRTWAAHPRQTRIGRRLASGLFRRLVGVLTGLTYCDTQAGLKGFRTASCMPVFAMLRIPAFAFDVELLSIAYHYRLQVRQIPVRFSNNHQPPEHSSVNLFKNSVVMVIDLFRINLNWKRGLYRSNPLSAMICKKTYVVD